VGLPKTKAQPMRLGLEARIKNLSDPTSVSRRVTIADLDDEGAALEMTDPFPLLSQVALDFTIDQREINVIAKVVSHREDGLNLRFVHIPMAEKRIIRQAMSRAPGAPPSSRG
jgi:hypothetical protein